MSTIVAFAHFILTELRVWIVMWYTIFLTTKHISIEEAIKQMYLYSCCHKDIPSCVEREYLIFLGTGTSIDCSNLLCGKDIGPTFSAAGIRGIVFGATVWLLGIYLILIVLFLYKRPNYNKGDYISFTQWLYSSKIYCVVSIITVVAVISLMLGGMVLIEVYGGKWNRYLVSMFVAIIGGKKLLELKHEGFKVDSENFKNIEISRGNTFFQKLFRFIFTSNAGVLDGIEVQFMRQMLPTEAAAEEEKGCFGRFAGGFKPLSRNDINKLIETGSSGHDNEMSEPHV